MEQYVFREIGGGSGTNEYCPFKVNIKTSTDEDVIINLNPGHVNGMVPSNFREEITLTIGPTWYIFLHCETDGFVITSLKIDFDVTEPDPIAPRLAVAPRQFDILLAIVDNGKVYDVWPCGNISALIVKTLQSDKTTFVPTISPYNFYYTWQIKTFQE